MHRTNGSWWSAGAGVARHFADPHRALPDDVIFAALGDRLGWDPVHEVFGELGDRERWPIPWLEDDPAMWLPQLHGHRFARDIRQSRDHGCQGIFGIHWRHRIVDPTANYFARALWDPETEPAEEYRRYGRTQAGGKRAEQLAELLDRAEGDRELLSTWTGEVGADGHAVTRALSGDYSEAFLIDAGYDVPDNVLDSQARLLDELATLSAGCRAASQRGSQTAPSARSTGVN